jgi:hypothetical protein
LRWIHPAALIEAEDVHFCVGKAPGDRRAGGAGADDQDVNGIVHFGSFGYSGARVSANPESRDSGFDAAHRPGMTSAIDP